MKKKPNILVGNNEDHQMKKKPNIIVGSLVIILIYACFIAYSFHFASERNAEMNYQHIEEIFDDVDRESAILVLSELRGRILEIESLSHNDIAQTVMLNELENLTAHPHYTNPYVEDFTFNIPSTSNVGELCEELISQIDDQLNVIR